MKITVARSAGFCFGVKKALKIALDAAATSDQVEMLGDIVHNEDVVAQIERSGIKKVCTLTSGKNKTLLIRAHGVGKNTLEEAQRLTYNIVDATCPMVKEIHRITEEMDDKGYKIVIIGDKKHDEVRGIMGHTKSRALVIDGIENIPLEEIKKTDKAAVVVQSTQRLENVLEILEALKPHIAKLKFFNTICRPTRIKQEEMKSLPLENNVMIVIGSKTSANMRYQSH